MRESLGKVSIHAAVSDALLDDFSGKRSISNEIDMFDSDIEDAFDYYDAVSNCLNPSTDTALDKQLQAIYDKDPAACWAKLNNKTQDMTLYPVGKVTVT